MSAANRRRGHDCERAIVAWLRQNGWPDACTTRSKLGHDGSHTPGDIDFAPGVCLEAKDVGASRWPTWRAQCVAEAGGRIPVVVRRFRGMPDVGRWEAHIPVPVVEDLMCHTRPTLNDVVHCKRTDMAWLRTTFSNVCALLAVEH